MKAFSARELLAQVYKKFETSGRKIQLPRVVEVEVGCDNDYHRSKYGYFKYESAILATIGEKQWVVTFGTFSRGYPAQPYDCDIAAMRFDENATEQEIPSMLGKNSYFHYSLVCAMTDGDLCVNHRGRWGELSEKSIQPVLSEYTAREAQVNSSLITPDLTPVIESGKQYKPEFSNFLHSVFSGFLQ